MAGTGNRESPFEITGLHSPQQPADDAAAVTPNNVTDITLTRGLYIGVGGNLRVNMRTGTDVTFVGVVAGTTLGIRVTRVWDTSTTASSIVALY